MKKTIATFMLVVCLTFCWGNITALAQEYIYCPYCGTALVTIGENVDHWSITRTFTDAQGASVKCVEYFSVDRIYKYCNNGHGLIQSYDIESESHSLASCPYRK